MTTIAIFLYEMISALIRVVLLGTGKKDAELVNETISP